eukprot:Hpha_TRINITY_DN15760_c0_g1::TRINITY_DN15760_c0_g1_i1::g.39684::m.39684
MSWKSSANSSRSSASSVWSSERATDSLSAIAARRASRGLQDRGLSSVCVAAPRRFGRRRSFVSPVGGGVRGGDGCGMALRGEVIHGASRGAVRTCAASGQYHKAQARTVSALGTSSVQRASGRGEGAAMRRDWTESGSSPSITLGSNIPELAVHSGMFELARTLCRLAISRFGPRLRLGISALAAAAAEAATLFTALATAAAASAEWRAVVRSRAEATAGRGVMLRARPGSRGGAPNVTALLEGCAVGHHRGERTSPGADRLERGAGSTVAYSGRGRHIHSPLLGLSPGDDGGVGGEESIGGAGLPQRNAAAKSPLNAPKSPPSLTSGSLVHLILPFLPSP